MYFKIIFKISKFFLTSLSITRHRFGQLCAFLDYRLPELISLIFCYSIKCTGFLTCRLGLVWFCCSVNNHSVWKISVFSGCHLVALLELAPSTSGSHESRDFGNWSDSKIFTSKTANGFARGEFRDRTFNDPNVFITRYEPKIFLRHLSWWPGHFHGLKKYTQSLFCTSADRNVSLLLLLQWSSGYVPGSKPAAYDLTFHGSNQHMS